MLTAQDEVDARGLLLLLDDAEQRTLYVVADVLLNFHHQGWAPFADERIAPILRLLGRLTADLEKRSDTAQVISQILRVLVVGGTAEPASEQEGAA